MDNEAVKRALVIDPDWVCLARQAWLAAMGLAVWGDVRSSRLGVTARLPTIQRTVQTQITRTMGMNDEEIEASRERLNTLRIE